jgi:RNA polymerase sigma factor (sigma-70 family)
MNKEEYLINNRALIAKLATKYYMKTPKFDFEDLVAVGNKAAFRALGMYDANKGKISTYVSQAVIRDIRDYVSANKHDLRVSTYGQRKACEAVKRGEKDPLTNNMALRIDWTERSSDSSGLGYDAIPSGEPPVDYTLMKREQVEILMEELDELPEREQSIIRSRFFDGDTLIQIADRMKLTKQRINQIEARAMSKLRSKVIKRLDGELIE